MNRIEINLETGETTEIPLTEEEIAEGAARKAVEDRWMRTAQIKAALVELDFKSIRPLREGDADRVASFKAQAESLRKELESL